MFIECLPCAWHCSRIRVAEKNETDDVSVPRELISPSSQNTALNSMENTKISLHSKLIKNSQGKSTAWGQQLSILYMLPCLTSWKSDALYHKYFHLIHKVCFAFCPKPPSARMTMGFNTDLGPESLFLNTMLNKLWLIQEIVVTQSIARKWKRASRLRSGEILKKKK